MAAWFGGLNPAPWTVAGLPSSIDLLVLDEAPLELAGRVALRVVLLFDDDPAARVTWLATPEGSTSMSGPVRRPPVASSSPASEPGRRPVVDEGPKRSYLGLSVKNPKFKGREEPR